MIPFQLAMTCGAALLVIKVLKAAMKLISKADVVIALGTRLGPFGTSTSARYGLLAERMRRLFRLMQTTKCLGLVKPINVGICGDAKAVASVLCQKLESAALLIVTQQKVIRAKTIADEKAAWELELDEWIHETDSYSMDMIANKEEGWLHPKTSPKRA